MTEINKSKKELIINVHQQGMDIALLENKAIIELHKESHLQSLSVGDIFLTKPRKLLPGLNAAFINMGIEKDAFIHYSDLGPQVKSLIKFTNLAIESKLSPDLDTFVLEDDLHKTGNIVNILPKKTNLLVQVVKEPIGSKGPRLSCDISLAGRYVVLIPFVNTLIVSKKIVQEEERKRLIVLCESIRPQNFGFIIRTAAENSTIDDLRQDVMDLQTKWKQVVEELHNAPIIKKILSEQDKTTTLLRDLINDSFDKVITNNKNIYRLVTSYIERMAKRHNIDVELYKGNIALFDFLDINRQIKNSFGKIVVMPNGSYLIIEKTEACHVIDVNSGNRMIQSSQEESAFIVNKEAAVEIARLIRLRDIGGIIVIDFIDVKKLEYKNEIYKIIKESMSGDRAKHSILPLSKFSLCQITRERVRPEVNVKIDDQCEQCNGTGKYTEHIDLITAIYKKLIHIIQQLNLKKITLEVHPFVHAHLTKGLCSIQRRWWWRMKQWTRIKSNNTISTHHYKILDEDNEEIII